MASLNHQIRTRKKERHRPAPSEPRPPSGPSPAYTNPATPLRTISEALSALNDMSSLQHASLASSISQVSPGYDASQNKAGKKVEGDKSGNSTLRARKEQPIRPPLLPLKERERKVPGLFMKSKKKLLSQKLSDDRSSLHLDSSTSSIPQTPPANTASRNEVKGDSSGDSTSALGNEQAIRQVISPSEALQSKMSRSYTKHNLRSQQLGINLLTLGSSSPSLPRIFPASQNNVGGSDGGSTFSFGNEELRQAIQPLPPLKAREKQLQRLFMKKKLGSMNRGKKQIAGHISRATSHQQPRAPKKSFNAAAPIVSQESKAVEEDVVTVNENGTAAQQHNMLAGGQAEKMEHSTETPPEDCTPKEILTQNFLLCLRPAWKPPQEATKRGVEIEANDRTDEGTNGSVDVALDSEDEFYDARSVITEDEVSSGEHRAVVQTKDKLGLSKEIWGLVLEELYNIEHQPGSTFNVPLSFGNYRLVSRTFHYHITCLTYRHLELHGRPESWNASAIGSKMRRQKRALRVNSKYKFNYTYYTREITIRETPGGYPNEAPEIIQRCQNLKYINWICLWHPKQVARIKPFPDALQSVLRQFPHLCLRIENFSLPMTEPEKVLEAVPTQNLVSLELSVEKYEISRAVRDFLVSAKNLKTLRLAPHGNGTSRFGFHFGSAGDVLPPIKDLYLESYCWLLYHFNSPRVWRFPDLEYLTMDDASLIDFLMAVADMPFRYLRKIVLRDTKSSPEKVPHILSGLHTLVSSATHLQELDVLYRSKSLFYSPKEKDRGTSLVPFTRLHVLRGVDGVSNILDAILAAGQ